MHTHLNPVHLAVVGEGCHGDTTNKVNHCYSVQVHQVRHPLSGSAVTLTALIYTNTEGTGKGEWHCPTPPSLPHLPDQVGVHELCPDGAEYVIDTVLHQTQLSRIEDHAHLRRVVGASICLPRHSAVRCCCV